MDSRISGSLIWILLALQPLSAMADQTWCTRAEPTAPGGRVETTIPSHDTSGRSLTLKDVSRRDFGHCEVVAELANAVEKFKKTLKEDGRFKKECPGTGMPCISSYARDLSELDRAYERVIAGMKNLPIENSELNRIAHGELVYAYKIRGERGLMNKAIDSYNGVQSLPSPPGLK